MEPPTSKSVNGEKEQQLEKYVTVHVNNTIHPSQLGNLVPLDEQDHLLMIDINSSTIRELNLAVTANGMLENPLGKKGDIALDQTFYTDTPTLMCARLKVSSLVIYTIHDNRQLT